MFIQFDTKIRVRYAEADRMGYVYYGNYAMYFESARTEMLRSLGFSYREWEDNGIILPVRELQIRYHAPAYYDDLLTIRTIIKEEPSARITFHHEVYNEKGEKTCSGSLVLVFINSETRRPTRAPEFFLKALEEASESQS
jgi:acyl-CoA thioester hydrolase